MFVVCTDINACNCTRGCTDTERVCAESRLREENPIPHGGIKPASAAWQSDALTNWATSHPLCGHVWCWRALWAPQCKLIWKDFGFMHPSVISIIIIVSYQCEVIRCVKLTDRMLVHFSLHHWICRNPLLLYTTESISLYFSVRSNTVIFHLIMLFIDCSEFFSLYTVE